ncbi:MAG: PA2169 family four-helix-bundle protein [Myxococcota bacterium]|nr:PA2169 family four-helix-bundle protein [Myxococcota bacterium]
MDTKAVIALMRDLVHLDVDAIHAYGQAIKNIDVASVRSELERYQADHERHVTELSAAIVALGGEPPAIRRDVKGFFIEGMTALRSAMGTEQSLKAMLTNEKLTNREYDKAMKMALTPDIDALIRRNREDERRHLQYVEDAIARRVWEQAPRHA